MAKVIRYEFNQTGTWTNKVVKTFSSLTAAKAEADRLNGERDDHDELCMVSYVAAKL